MKDGIYRIANSEQIDRLIAACATIGMMGRVGNCYALRAPGGDQVRGAGAGRSSADEAAPDRSPDDRGARRR